MREQDLTETINRSLYKIIKRDSFAVGSNCLIVEDRIHRLFPQRSERILRLAGKGVYYSMVPLDPEQHRLLCYQYCADALKKRPHNFYRHALVLGCGGGAVPRWLLEEYPGLTVDVVDISRTMIDICRKYFLYEWEDSPRLTYYCTDAQDFVPPGPPYQFIFCDMFDGTELVPFVYSRAFAAKLRGMLCADGILVINCGWGHLDEIRSIYRGEFACVQVLDRPSWQTEVVRMSDRDIK